MLKNAVIAAGIFGFVGVAMGAFGAHAMKDSLVRSGLLSTYQTASLYCLVHALALLGVGVLDIVSPSSKTAIRLRWATRCFVFGIGIFSGSLWALAIFEIKWLGAITPVGGVILLAGWCSVLLAGISRHSAPE